MAAVITPDEILDSRIHQSIGMLGSIQSSYTEDVGFQMSGTDLYNALDGVHSLLTQARDAIHQKDEEEISRARQV